MKTLRLHFLPFVLAPALAACPGDDSPPPATDGGSSTTDGTGPTTNPPVTMTGADSTGATTAPGDTTTDTTTDATTNATTDATTGSATDSGTTDGTEDSGTTDGSESGSSSSSGGGVMDDTIYEIQDGTIAAGVDVDVQGVIVTGVGGSGFFAQEPGGGQYSGVYVYIDAVPMVAVGDEIDILGTTEEFNDLTEINAVLGSVTPTGMTGLNLLPEVVPAADLTAMTGEPWEGVLVRIEGAPLTVSNLPGFDEFDVNDGGPDDTRIDNFLHSVFDFPAVYPNFDVGASFTAIQGPLNFTFGEFKVAPREDTDLEGYMPVPGPAMGFGDCATMDPATVCLAGEICVVDDPLMTTIAICSLQGCVTAVDCPPVPPGGDAPAQCNDVTADGVLDCSLDCSAGQTCPTGMNCFAGFVCAWPV